MTIIAVVLFITISFFWAYRKYLAKSLNLIDLLLAIQIVAQFVIVEHDIGPVSLRIYNIAVLFFLFIVNVSVKKLNIFANKITKALFLIGVLTLGWMYVTSVIRGEWTNALLYNFLSYHVYAILWFLVLQYFARTREKVIFLSSLLVIIAAVNACAALAQWAGIDSAWALFEALVPDSQMRNEDLLVFEKRSFGYTPGLQSYSVPLSYLMLFGLIVWSYLLVGFKKTLTLKKSFTILLLLIFQAGIVVSLSRSSFVVFNFLVVVSFFWFSKRFLTNRTSKGGLIGAILILGFLYVLLIELPNMSYESIKGYDTSRLFVFSNSGRISLWMIGISLAFRHPLLGPGNERFVTELGELTAPHNLFVNSLVSYGVPGFIFTVLLLWQVVKLCKHSLRKAIMFNPISAHSIGLVLVLIGYILKGMFHNDSFSTGGIIGWLLIGLISGDCCSTESNSTRNDTRYS
ncbi:MAG: O-antigen ligase family protein [Bdellovibrionota bacterium]